MSGIERVAVQPIELRLVSKIPQAPGKDQPGGKLESVLNQFLNDLKEMQQDSGQIESQKMAGAVQDIHDVMIAAREAGISYEMIVEFRNKLLEAYQELMRMQV